MEDVDEVLRRARHAEREFRREKRTDVVDLLEALRRSVEAAQRRPEPSEPARAYKVGQAAAIIGVHRNTVRGWIERGLLKAKRIEIGERGDYLIPHVEVLRAKKAHFVSSTSDPLSNEQVEEYEDLLRGANNRGSRPARRPATVIRRRRAASYPLPH
ncbi:MAG: helix-turn-helix domain-containing protein [Candidatus Dormibacteraeota bacterium]|nr:helix-turn-helix domain-containing protein [Candidatus Dormibacteraeota bacterium]